MAAPATSPLDVRLHAMAVCLHRVSLHPDFTLIDIPAPVRVSPHATAISAETADRTVSGELIALLDPRHRLEWAGDIRLIAHVRAAIEPEIATDPCAPEIGWSWLVDALPAADSTVERLAGTITISRSVPFGALADRPLEHTMEIRASWTALDDDLTAHTSAWARLLCSAGGLPPADNPALRPLRRGR
ncbi:MAG: DUF3000 family protein [Actinomycetales bacterium]|nr:DUF3000 family protein [Actinomycetales bacterium]